MITLVDGNARDTIEAEVRKVEKIETAVEKRFQEHFVAAMAIPHKTHTFTELAKAVKLPGPKTDAQTSRRRRNRRSRSTPAL